MAGRQTLAEQLAAIRDDAPAEYDPESVGYTSSLLGKKDLDAGRSDYLSVGESKIRKGLSNELGGRYSGTKVSRAQLYGDDDEEENEEDEDISEDDEEDLDEEDDEEDNGESDNQEEDEDEDEDEEESHEEEDTQPKGRSKPLHGSGSNRHVEDDSRTMMQQLRKASSAEVQKGRAVKQQLSFWDTLLEARIRLQKCTSNLNVLPEPSSMSAYTSATSDSTAQAISSLEELSELLFALRRRMYETNDKITLPAPASGKRKRGSAEYVDEAAEEMQALAAAALPHERTTISKWSDKVSAASGTSATSQANKFTAIGAQNTLAQIESILAQDMGRLVERTRVRRTGANGNIVKVVGRDEVHEPIEGVKDEAPYIFDDHDFYQALLRSVLDGASQSFIPGSTSSNNPYTSAYPNKKRANVDTKASKGRKLRYYVHEKLQNFMAPIPVHSWEKEQTDELFRGLLGGRAAQETGREEARLAEEEIPTDVGQLRIFG